MTELSGTVRLIAPNGQLVSVAESKRDARLTAGYQLPRKRRAPSRSVHSPGEPAMLTVE